MKFILVEGQMKKATTKTEIRMKDGSVIKAGTKGKLRPVRANELPNRPAGGIGDYDSYTGIMAFLPDGGSREYKLKFSKLPIYFTGAGLKAPEPETIEKWEWEHSGCKTPNGIMVEPDGIDPDGWPAWTLILGIL
jgi:hypothetical protein